jgi:hypothetical protein
LSHTPNAMAVDFVADKGLAKVAGGGVDIDLA